MVSTKDLIQRFRHTRQRDITSLVAVVGPLLMVCSIIGAGYVLSYRVKRLESDAEATRERVDTVREEQLRRTELFKYLDEKLRDCCGRRNR